MFDHSQTGNCDSNINKETNKSSTDPNTKTDETLVQIQRLEDETVI